MSGGYYFFRDRFHSSSSLPTQSSATTITSEPVVQTLTGPGVLRRIQEQSKLETVSFKIETVVTSKKAGTWWKAWQDGQSAIVMVSGTVIAGVDLSKLRSEDVEVSSDGKTVRIKLPPAEILHTNLGQTRTYDYKTGVFGLINLDPKVLEQAQQDAQLKLRDTACASDILSMATANGQRQVENLFAMLDVRVNIVASSPSPCLSTSNT